MEPNEQAAARRLMAACLRHVAAEHDLAATCAVTAQAFSNLSNTWRAAEAKAVASHPDLAELDVQLDGFYSAD
jgi:tellurite resistance protein